MTVRVLPKFLSEDECSQLNSWVDQGLGEGLLVGAPDGNDLTDYSHTSDKRLSTRKTPPTKLKNYPACVFSIQKRIESNFNLTNLKTSRNGGLRGIIVNCTFPGGDIWEHIDPMEDRNAPDPSLHTLRFNVITQLPEQGGELFVNGHKIELCVGDLHGYLVTKHPHYVTKNTGNVNRICWLFGYQLHTSDKRFLQWSIE